MKIIINISKYFPIGRLVVYIAKVAVCLQLSSKHFLELVKKREVTDLTRPLSFSLFISFIPILW
jgi:hypothetical protein